MGEVYRAPRYASRSTRRRQVLAGETASPHALERFEREAKAIAALNHPGICAVHDVGTTPVPFLVMELLDGETLHERLTRGPLEVHTLLEMALTLADALAAAHAKGIIHRDLKPANIFVTAHGPKVLDFGLARVTEAVTVDVGVTAPTLAETPLTDAGVAVGDRRVHVARNKYAATPSPRRPTCSRLVSCCMRWPLANAPSAVATTGVISAAILHEHPRTPRQLRPELPSASRTNHPHVA
jgi:serine/threonine protein kinase